MVPIRKSCPEAPLCHRRTRRERMLNSSVALKMLEQKSKGKYLNFFKQALWLVLHGHQSNAKASSGLPIVPALFLSVVFWPFSGFLSILMALEAWRSEVHNTVEKLLQWNTSKAHQGRLASVALLSSNEAGGQTLSSHTDQLSRPLWPQVPRCLWSNPMQSPHLPVVIMRSTSENAHHALITVLCYYLWRLIIKLPSLSHLGSSQTMMVWRCSYLQRASWTGEEGAE